ncbi:hypothetical protein ES705_05790 [subsurface metagenome]
MILAIILGIISGILSGFIVYFMINLREKRKWKITSTYLLDESRRLTAGILTSVRVKLKIPFHPSSNYNPGVYQEYIDFSKNIIVEKFINLEYKIFFKQVKSKEWLNFINFLQAVRNSIETNLSISLNLLDPSVSEKLLNLRKEIDSVIIYYSTFPDVIGVPLDQQSPSTKFTKEESSNRIHQQFFDNIKSLTFCAIESLELLIKPR